MAKPFLTPPSKTALVEAVCAVEARSSAELVIAVRARTGSYLHAGLITGILAGLVALAVLLYSPWWTFEPVWFLADPLLIGALVGLAAVRSSRVGRAFTPWRLRRQRVEAAARSTFVERRVHSTTGRTGILFYVSVLEREIAIVVDLGVEPLAATAGWRQAIGEIERAVRDKEDGVALAARIRGLAELLEPVLVRGENDVDELPNEVC
jgi:putative membrane protein